MPPCTTLWVWVPERSTSAYMKKFAKLTRLPAERARIILRKLVHLDQPFEPSPAAENAIREGLRSYAKRKPTPQQKCAPGLPHALCGNLFRGFGSSRAPKTRLDLSAHQIAARARDPWHAQIEVPRLSTLNKRLSSFARKSYSLTVSIVLSITRPVNRSIATWTQ